MTPLTMKRSFFLTALLACVLVLPSQAQMGYGLYGQGNTDEPQIGVGGFVTVPLRFIEFDAVDVRLHFHATYNFGRLTDVLQFERDLEMIDAGVGLHIERGGERFTPYLLFGFSYDSYALKRPTRGINGNVGGEEPGDFPRISGNAPGVFGGVGMMFLSGSVRPFIQARAVYLFDSFEDTAFTWSSETTQFRLNAGLSFRF